ncbi:MAG: hypothetical protein UE068_13310, partial [Paludibacteraceae bacterium]|nr:hypothetical protein [Paludibacteraceae bacterium]
IFFIFVNIVKNRLELFEGGFLLILGEIIFAYCRLDDIQFTFHLSTVGIHHSGEQDKDAKPVVG